MIIPNHIQSRINTIISGRLENSVSLLEVVNWLENFDESEIDQALDILEKLEYFSVARSVSIYNDNLRRIFSNFTEKNVIFLAIGEFGKSGTAMSYFIKQAPSFTDKRFKKKKYLASSKFDLQKIVAEHGINLNDFLLILMDDFIGSGRSTIEFVKGDEHNPGLEKYLKDQALNPKISILSLIILNEGKNHIENEIPDVYISAETRAKIFTSKGSIFGYRPKMLPLRELAYKKGSMLMKKQEWSLGYDNSQGLVAFAHTTPNNTLPIFWSSEKEWHPLYPRFGRDKIEKLKKFRDESNYWLSMATNNGIGFFTGEGAGIYNTINIQLITIMRLKFTKRTIPTICQIMGITLQEYEDVFAEGVKRGLFLKKGQISDSGTNLYEEIKKKMLFRRNRQKRLAKGNDEIIYLPMTFRGET
jgi:hypothetical protein